MGIFDFFKKKPSSLVTPVDSVPEQQVSPTEQINTGTHSINDYYAEQAHSPELKQTVALITRYKEYVMLFVNMMMQDNYSPIAAYEKSDGELVGYLYFSNDQGVNLSIEEVLEQMEQEFERRLSEEQITSYALFYHSTFNGVVDDHSIAGGNRYPKAISVKYKAGAGISGFAGLPYHFEGDEISFHGFKGFTREENNVIMGTALLPDKDYLQERVEIKAEVRENEAGIRIKKTNQASIGDMWNGIFGYERLHDRNGSQLLREYCALALSREPRISNSEVTVSEQGYFDVAFRAVKSRDDAHVTIFPVVKTEEVLPFQTREIAEWTHTGCLEAVISGTGRDTFGLSFFATDYAFKKAIYHSETAIRVQVSGIVLVLEERVNEDLKTGDDAALSPDFCGYIPNKEMKHLGCFDFYGILESYRPVKLLEDLSISGYILQMKLINDPEEPGLFTIDLFVNRQNMKSDRLAKGMRFAGLVWLQGELCG